MPPLIPQESGRACRPSYRNGPGRWIARPRKKICRNRWQSRLLGVQIHCPRQRRFRGRPLRRRTKRRRRMRGLSSRLRPRCHLSPKRTLPASPFQSQTLRRKSRRRPNTRLRGYQKNNVCSSPCGRQPLRNLAPMTTYRDPQKRLVWGMVRAQIDTTQTEPKYSLCPATLRRITKEISRPRGSGGIFSWGRKHDLHSQGYLGFRTVCVFYQIFYT